MAEDPGTLDWQRRMASFMTASVIVAAVFFAVVTLWEFRSFQARLFEAEAPFEDVLSSLRPTTYQEQVDVARMRTALALERDIIRRRYGQTNMSIATRLWTRLMGFITGMILALVGAAFILGKLKEDVSEAAAKAGLPGQELSFSVRSASPGIVLAVMGTVLMALSISIQSNFSTEDQAIYFDRVTPTSTPPKPGEASGPAAPALSGMLKPPKPTEK